MKLYWGKHTCAIGVHIVLEEIGALAYELCEVDVPHKAELRPPFIDMNPKGKVPVLIRDDGAMLTEYGAIVSWLARTHPQAGLLPEDAEGEARMREAMDYLVGHIHALAFPRIFFPEQFAPAASQDEAVKAQVQAEGRRMADEGFAILADKMGGAPWAAGEVYTVADSAFFYAERWAAETGVTLPPAIAAHFERMKARPAVARVRQVWGEA